MGPAHTDGSSYAVRKTLGRMVRHGYTWRAAAYGKLNAALDDIVAYMLFADEIELRDQVQGVSEFTRTFAARGPRDQQGRSLRDFDLRTRLFRYPLSFMIYSELFDSMPAAARDGVYQRLCDVFTGRAESAQFSRLSAADRRAVLEILRATKPHLPE
jgi:hypothetical protein